MSDTSKFTISSASGLETQELAEKLGSLVRGSEIIELIGDVGAGKTTFVRGFAKGAGSESRVSSPTFTVSNVYNAPHFDIHHYDFYRLDDLSIIETELKEVTSDKKNVAILEWAESIQRALPADHISIHITVTGNESRVFTCTIPTQYEYLRAII